MSHYGVYGKSGGTEVRGRSYSVMNPLGCGVPDDAP